MKINLVSRYVPIANRAGHFSYLLDLICYMHHAGFQLELDVLDPWFLPENIPDELHELAHVVLMPASYIKEESPLQTKQSRQSLLRLLIQHLPPAMLAPLRKYWYQWRGKSVPGHHAPDEAATEAEIAFVADRLSHYKPNVFIANETFLGNLLSLCSPGGQILKVSIAFDVQHLRQQSFQQVGRSQSQIVWTREKETELLSAADLIVAIHEDEAAMFREMLPKAEMLCVPMAADLHYHPEEQQVPGRCLFVGSNITPNVQGLQWFLNEVWSGILQQHSSASLHVCGSVCGQFSRSYQQVEFLGRVENLDPEYAAAELCIIPLLAGSGLKIKLVEALSHGRTCVATSIGAQGLQKLEGKALLVAETPETFANAVLSVLRDAAKRQTMEQEARQYVTDVLSPDKAYQPFVERIQQHLDRQRGISPCQ